MTFKLKPRDAAREDQSEAQRTATDRNFGIFRLRGLWHQASLLNEPYRSTVQALIDIDLTQRGALPQREHERASRLKLRKSLERRPKVDAEEDDDIPF